ncbi:MAG: hypothetical protein ACRDZ7_20490 [Acidimicrobiia bacterium]
MPLGGYSAAKFLLELDGNPAGFLASLEGGEPFAEVVEEHPAQNGVVKKHPGPVRYAPIIATCGPGMSASLYAWIAAMLDGTQTASDGAVIALDFNYREVWRLEFEQSLITDVVFPSVDGTSKKSVFIELTFQPAVTRIDVSRSGESHGGLVTKSQSKWLAANFRLKVDQLPTAKVVGVDPIVVTQPIKHTDVPALDGPVKVSGVAFTLRDSDATPVRQWHDDFVVQGNHGSEHERAGTLELLDPNLQNVLFSVTLAHLGIVRVVRDRQDQAAQVVTRTRAEMYCEQVGFAVKPDVVGVPALAAGKVVAPEEGVHTAAAVIVGKAVLAALEHGGSSTRLLASLGKAGVLPEGPVALSPDAAKALAEQLITSEPELAGPAEDRRRVDGRALGRSWATQRASLSELENIVGLDDGPWDALRLAEDHSLFASLHDAGLIPATEVGPMELGRDPFVEGLVDGASLIHKQVLPHLAQLRLERQVDEESTYLELASNLARQSQATRALADVLLQRHRDDLGNLFLKNRLTDEGGTPVQKEPPVDLANLFMKLRDGEAPDDQ